MRNVMGHRTFQGHERHLGERGILRILHHRYAAALGYCAKARGAVAKRAGQDYSDSARSAAHRGRAQHRVDGGTGSTPPAEVPMATMSRLAMVCSAHEWVGRATPRWRGGSWFGSKHAPDVVGY